MPNGNTTTKRPACTATVLAVDPGKCAGWSLWMKNGNLITSGSIKDHPYDTSDLLKNMEYVCDRLDTLDEHINLTVVVVEGVMSFPMKSKAARTYLSATYLAAKRIAGVTVPSL